jgi:hypothetical protein
MGISLKGEEFLNKLAELYEEYGAEHFTDADGQENIIVIGLQKDTIPYEEMYLGFSNVDGDTIREFVKQNTTVCNGLPTSG